MKLNIKEIREAKGLSIRDLAKRMGTSSANISRWENGHVDITLTRLHEIAEALKVSPKKLF